MRYHVMLECEDGMHVLHSDPLRWERRTHVITWCTEDTPEAAVAALRDLDVERNPTARHAWVEAR